MATPALNDPDFTYFAQETEIKAKCNYCGMIVNPSSVDHHREICKENPKHLH